MIEKFSDLHQDAMHPFTGKDKPEYDPEKGYPHKHPDIGEEGEFSIIHRISQFGVTEADLQGIGVANPMDVTQEQYIELMKEATERQVDTLFASIYGRWAEMDTSDQQRVFVEKVAGMYKQWGLNLIEGGGQMSAEEPNLVIALEGADFMKSLADVDKAHDLGIRSIMPQYNRPNALAGNDGLTDLGRQAVQRMLDKGIIVDLAHSNPGVRGDIFDIVEDAGQGELVAYSHGALAEDIAGDSQFSSAAEKRGLSREELSRIIKLEGIVGLGVTKPFTQSVDQLTERIDDIFQIDKGPRSLGLGTDFGGVSQALSVGISGAEDIAKIGDILASRFKYDDAQVRQVLRSNIHNWTERVLRAKGNK